MVVPTAQHGKFFMKNSLRDQLKQSVNLFSLIVSILTGSFYGIWYIGGLDKRITVLEGRYSNMMQEIRQDTTDREDSFERYQNKIDKKIDKVTDKIELILQKLARLSVEEKK